MVINSVVKIMSPDSEATVICASVLFAYQLITIVQISFLPSEWCLYLNDKKNSLLMDKWLNKYLFAPTTLREQLTAIHTLRNIIIVAIFLGGYSLNTGLALLRKHQNTSMGKTVLAVQLLLGFLCWAQVIRNADHLGMAITSMTGDKNYTLSDGHPASHSKASAKPTDSSTSSAGPTSINAAEVIQTTACAGTIAQIHGHSLANRISVYFNAALRFIYHSIPFAFYGYGHIVLYTSTAIILLLEIMWDYGSTLTEILCPNCYEKVDPVESTTLGKSNIFIELN